MSELGFELELRIAETFLLPALTLCISLTLTKSVLLVNPKHGSLQFRPVNEAGTAPVDIFTETKLSRSVPKRSSTEFYLAHQRVANENFEIQRPVRLMRKLKKLLGNKEF